MIQPRRPFFQTSARSIAASLTTTNCSPSEGVVDQDVQQRVLELRLQELRGVEAMPAGFAPGAALPA